MLCVKCPLQDEWQMLKQCMPCRFSGNQLKGEITCTYDEYKKDQAYNYIRKEMTLKEIKKFIEERETYIELNGVKFYYNPTKIEIDNDLLDYMNELSQCQDEESYVITEGPSQGIIIY